MATQRLLVYPVLLFESWNDTRSEYLWEPSTGSLRQLRRGHSTLDRDGSLITLFERRLLSEAGALPGELTKDLSHIYGLVAELPLFTEWGTVVSSDTKGKSLNTIFILSPSTEINLGRGYNPRVFGKYLTWRLVSMKLCVYDLAERRMVLVTGEGDADVMVETDILRIERIENDCVFADGKIAMHLVSGTRMFLPNFDRCCALKDRIVTVNEKTGWVTTTNWSLGNSTCSMTLSKDETVREVRTKGDGFLVRVTGSHPSVARELVYREDTLHL